MYDSNPNDGYDQAYVDHLNAQETGEPVIKVSWPKSVTVRASGKCHPAIQFADGQVFIVCKCPGSQNGQLAHNAVKIADGYDAVNCRKGK